MAYNPSVSFVEPRQPRWQSGSISYPPISPYFCVGWRKGDPLPSAQDIPRGVAHVFIPVDLLLELMVQHNPPASIIDPSMT